jgi:hypothetical protein
MKHVLFVAGLLGLVFTVNAQGVKYIQLKQQGVTYSPRGFYISGVTDDRTDKSSIGEMTGGGRKDKIAFEKGTAPALENFIEHNVTQDNSTQAIVMHITKMDVNARKEGGEWKIDAALTFTFYAAGKQVVEYSGKGHGQIDGDAGEYIDGFLRTAIENDLKRFDAWWEQNKGRVPTSSQVKVNVTMGRTTDKPNCMVYSLQRPLVISDFTGPVEEQIPELAATFSGIGMGYSGKTQNGQVVLDIVVTPYFDRSNSWFKAAGKNPRVLAHEQTHFDISAIKACELASAIRKASFTQENYSGLLDEMQRQNAKESNEEEATYDTETNHGTIEDKQLEWEKKIKEKVKETGCY